MSRADDDDSRLVGRLCTDCGEAYVVVSVRGPDAEDRVRSCGCPDTPGSVSTDD